MPLVRSISFQRWRCDRFLGRTIVPAPLVVDSDFPVIMAGTLLASKDIHCAVVRRGKRVKGALYGYQMVSFLLESKSDELYSRLWRSIARVQETIPVAPLPTMELRDYCSEVLAKIVAARFGDLLILNSRGDPIGLLTIGLMLDTMAGKAHRLGLKLTEVASPLSLTNPRQSAIEAFRFMMRHRVRRTVIKRGTRFYCCTEREIMKSIFSLHGLESIRDDPESFLAKPIEYLVGTFVEQIPSVYGHTDVAEAWKLAAKTPLATLVVDGKMIATPWDLVIKPFLAGKVPF